MIFVAYILQFHNKQIDFILNYRNSFHPRLVDGIYVVVVTRHQFIAKMKTPTAHEWNCRMKNNKKRAAFVYVSLCLCVFVCAKIFMSNYHLQFLCCPDLSLSSPSNSFPSICTRALERLSIRDPHQHTSVVL